MTFGLNWFLNPNARFQFNYVMSWINNAPPVTFPGTVGSLNGSRFVGDGTVNSFGGRMEINYLKKEKNYPPAVNRVSVLTLSRVHTFRRRLSGACLA